MNTILTLRVNAAIRFAAFFLISVGGIAIGLTRKLSLHDGARPIAESPTSYWETFVTAPDRRLIDNADTASQCLALADAQLARGYWRLSLLRSGAVKILRPPASANWAAAILAIQRGEKLARRDAKRGHPVPAVVWAALISRRAIFFFHRSPPDDQRAVLRAIAALRRAIGMDPKSAQILSELGSLYGELASLPQMSPEEKLAALKKTDMYARAALRLNPRCPEAYWELAGAQVSSGNVAAAIKLRIKALTLTRFSDPAYYVYDYHAVNFWTKAMAKYIKAVRPNAYRKIRGQIAYFSPGGIPYSDVGRVLTRDRAEAGK